MSTLVELLEETIHQDWRVPREGSRWKITETSKGATHTELFVSSGRSIVFSLDQSGLDPWPYIKSNTAISGIRSVCDALIALSTEGRDYFIALEMKSSTSGEASARKQIARSKAFVEFIASLLEFDSQWNGEYVFIGIISTGARRQPKKGTTGRSSVAESARETFGTVLYLRNQDRINLLEVIKSNI